MDRQVTPIPKPPPRKRSKALLARRKGRTGEREFAALRGVERIPLSGALGGKWSGDVVETITPSDAGREWRWEVKRRAAACVRLYRWLELAVNEGVAPKPNRRVREGKVKQPDGVAFRMDNSPWLVVTTYERWAELHPQCQPHLEGESD